MDTAPSPAMKFGYATNVGRKRANEENQDSLLIIPTENRRPPLLIVADGMGGHAGGAVASKLVVGAIAGHYRQAEGVRDIQSLLGECLQKALEALREHASTNPDLATMGSTAVLAVPEEGRVSIANIGDSRAYLIRPRQHQAGVKPEEVPTFLRRLFPGKGETGAVSGKPDSGGDYELQQISVDHSEVAALVRSGVLTPAQALQSPLKNRLTQSISPHRERIEPFMAQVATRAEDVLLLCTDGLWGVVPEATLAAIAYEFPPQKAAEKLIQQAVNFGGPDNISVILTRFQ